MTERDTWEARHAARPARGLPSGFLSEHLPQPLPNRARALDLACGTGRHVALLREAGWRVVALDVARPAVSRLREEFSGLDGVVADATAVPFPAQSFDLIVKTRFLERSLFPTLATLLRPGGHLFVETFLVDQFEATGHPRRDFCLDRGELTALCRRTAPELNIVRHQECRPGPEGTPPALSSVLARRP